MAGTTPTIDGTIDSGEWDVAQSNTFYTFDFATRLLTKQVWIRAMNDASNLYLYIRWNDLTYDGNIDGIDIFFDEANDGNWSSPDWENGFKYQWNSTESVWFDGVTAFVPGGIAPDVVSKDGEAGFSWITFTYVVEVRIPIASADAEDIQSIPGAVIGIALVITEDLGGGGDYWEVPKYTGVNRTVLTFQLAVAPSGIGTPLELAYLLLAIGLITCIVLRKKNIGLSL